MDNCCDSLMKYILFLLNFFFFCTGVALICVGAYVQLEMKDYLNFVGDDYFNSSVLFIILGVAILIIGFFGCCGACTENPCMMTTFACLLTAVVIAQIGLAIAVYVAKGDVNDVITGKMREGLKNYGKDKYEGVTDTWNVVQNEFQCCGVSNYTNWKATDFSQESDLPDSCCKKEQEGCGKDFFEGGDVNLINTEGCFLKLEKVIKENIEVVGGIALAVLFIQVVLVLVSCMLANNMRRRASYV